MTLEDSALPAGRTIITIDNQTGKVTIDTGGATEAPETVPGASAYDLAVAAGYAGTEQEWLASLAGADGAPATNLMWPVRKSNGVWPPRPTASPSTTVVWIGSDPSPSIVASGTGGMLDNIDIRWVI